MVLTRTVGKKRPFIRGFLLTVLTFGIYGFYWLYKAHNELYRQFELDKEGRDEGVIWLILGLLLFPLQFVYAWIFVGNVQYLRNRLELRPGISPGGFLAMDISGYAAFMVAYIAMIVEVSKLGDAPTETEVTQALGPIMGWLLVAFVLFVVVRGLAYRRLQNDINEVWDAYDARMRTLQTQPATTSPAAPQGSYRYWGDLQPPASAPSAPHVRARADTLVRDHPGLVLPPDLADLLSRGDAGDVEALRSAVLGLNEVDARLRERSKLRADREAAERRRQRLAARLADGELDADAYRAARDELEREQAAAEARLADIEARLFTTPPASAE